MSYCRWSSDNFRSDVYVYEGVDDRFHTHLAGNRLLFPPVPEWPFLLLFGAKWDRENRTLVYPTRVHGWTACIYYSFTTLFNRLHHWSLRFIPRVMIKDELAGQSFEDNSAEECANRLEVLRKRGYYVPQRAIDNLRKHHELEKTSEQKASKT